MYMVLFFQTMSIVSYWAWKELKCQATEKVNILNDKVFYLPTKTWSFTSQEIISFETVLMSGKTIGIGKSKVLDFIS